MFAVSVIGRSAKCGGACSIILIVRIVEFG